jgi:hypothetical protein
MHQERSETMAVHVQRRRFSVAEYEQPIGVAAILG